MSLKFRPQVAGCPGDKYRSACFHIENNCTQSGFAICGETKEARLPVLLVRDLEQSSSSRYPVDLFVAIARNQRPQQILIGLVADEAHRAVTHGGQEAFVELAAELGQLLLGIEGQILRLAPWHRAVALDHQESVRRAVGNIGDADAVWIFKGGALAREDLVNRGMRILGLDIDQGIKL